MDANIIITTKYQPSFHPSLLCEEKHLKEECCIVEHQQQIEAAVEHDILEQV